jgi:hypothetical protein
MNKLQSSPTGYFIAVVLGATFGGIAVAILTRAAPKMMARMMANMMSHMQSRMGSQGFNPAEN